MDWKDIGSKLLAIGAPLLGTALGGPVGGMAATAAVGYIGKALGLPESEVTPEIIEAKFQDPDAVAALRYSEMNHANTMQRLLNEETQAYLADRQSARSREVEIVKATGSKDINLYILAYSFVGGFFVSIIVMLWLVLANKMPEAMPQYVVFLLGSLFGTLTAGVSAIIQYFFGSSKGSADKTKIMAQEKK